MLKVIIEKESFTEQLDKTLWSTMEELVLKNPE